MRLLITGSRTWIWRNVIEEAFGTLIARSDTPITVVSGACRMHWYKGVEGSADYLCEQVAKEAGLTVERHPAEWAKYGKRAGFLRNEHMVNLGADLCYAFIHNGSKGATHTKNLAIAAGIHTRIWRVKNI